MWVAAIPAMIVSSPTLRDTFGLLQREAEALPPSIRPLVTQIGAKSERSLMSGAADDLAARYRTQVLATVHRFRGRPVSVHARQPG